MGDSISMHELAFRPQRGDSRPLYRQLADYLSELIHVGRWAAGMKLPSTRVVAEDLGISRTTANLAYECLRDEGHVTSHVGQGTFVRVASPPPPSATEVSYAWGGLIASRVKALGIESLNRAAKPGRSAEFDFRGGRVDPSLLPARTLRQHFVQAFSPEALQEFANELDPRGWPALRQHIAASLLARGLRCHADQVVVTSGAQAGLDLISRVLLEPGDVVAMEEPGYFGAHLALRAAQAEWVGVPVDHQGIDVDALARLLRRRRVKLLYVTPAVQSPTGAQLSPERRQRCSNSPPNTNCRSSRTTTTTSSATATNPSPPSRLKRRTPLFSMSARFPKRSSRRCVWATSWFPSHWFPRFRGCSSSHSSRHRR